jgi:dihydrofolate reductase
MGSVVAEISVSLDGCVAGPNPTLDQPLGERGDQLHEWAVRLKSWREPHGLPGGETGPDDELVAEQLRSTGAVVMGRRMFSGGEGPWEDDTNANGWWGDEPRFHKPVFSDGVAPGYARFEITRAIESPFATHLRYRVAKQ